jgi:integrase
MIAQATLTALLESYLADRINCGACWRSQLATTIRRFDAWLGRESTVMDLDKRTVLGFVQHVGAEHSPRTGNARRCCLVALWNYAAESGILGPPPRMPKLRVPTRIPIAWTLDEMGSILQSARAVEGWWNGVPAALCWEMACLIFWDTAARLGELRAARCQDISLAAGTWLVSAESIKGGRADRLYRLHPQTLAVIERRLSYGRQGRLWPFQPGRRQVWLHLKKILARAGLPYDRKRMFHCFRRSAESHAARAIGVNRAAEAVGHSPEIARQHYIAPAILPTDALCDVLPRPGPGSALLQPGDARQPLLF